MNTSQKAAVAAGLIVVVAACWLLSKGRTSAAPDSKTQASAGWVDAGNAVRNGDVLVKVESVRLGPAPLKSVVSDRTEESTEPLLQVAIRFTNGSETRKIEYREWERGHGRIDMPHIVDEFDNHYDTVRFASVQPIGHLHEGASIYPGKSVTDVIVFEPPVEKATALRLTLPASNFGGEGVLRLEIPKAMISK